MVKITLVSLLHTLGSRFSVYPASLLLPLLEQHEGDVWLPACKGADVAALRQHGKGATAQSLAPLTAAWCDFATGEEGATPELDALANYDSEMMDNLQMYWHSPAKINSPITDNLFELRREVVEEAHGGKLADAWDSAQQARLAQILAGAKAGRDQLCFVEVEAAYWLRQRLGEMAEIDLVTPELG
ncbi:MULTISPECIES: hypothetical protein [Aeromonas]|uniref:hypothetical protein n=1 Tax=Aeromonas TaxID=642 RepID=UPI001FCC77D3|nr:hypothetical protein [Aeromonas dhakensis]MCJ2369319.1 hypothetical protein [Aeromonas dhakensis]MED7772291.1 hypothetical protein [Aeromonas dhakensis]HDX8368521.1 hypothetical protein [Aeromonas dhakensis]HDX8435726.1 hypothetical protein [Aeromonas dhakensis]HDZ8963338.1 hypothetical protein [Aeromonas dhakensis]